MQGGRLAATIAAMSEAWDTQGDFSGGGGNPPPLMVRGDIDGFFGLFVDNLLQLMLIKLLCSGLLSMPDELVNETILPGAAVSILVGNLFYAWQARRLMKRTGRSDVTALPYGINTPSLFIFIFLIMLPVYSDQIQKTPSDPQRAATLAWQAGLFACFGSGVIEIIGAFVGDWVRRWTPRAALLSALAGIAITFIAINFVFQIFDNPGIALLPMLIVLTCYAARARTAMPAGMVAIIVGAGLATIWTYTGMPLFEPPPETWVPPWQNNKLAYLPPVVPGDVFAVLSEPDMGLRFFAVIFPMGLFNVIGSLQNLESAEVAGDRFETRPSLLTNGIGTLAAAFCGSCFPTTIYIGHPGWKAMGARAAYSTINGVVITALCLVGGVTLVLQVIPLEATLGILLWIGVIITAQAFAAVPKRHTPAVAIGLIPALAAWALLLIEGALRVAGTNLYQTAHLFGRNRGEIYIYGVIALERGFLLTSLVLAAMTVHIIERKFRLAALWCMIASLLSAIGLIHAFDWSSTGIDYKYLSIQSDPFKIEMAAPTFAMMYAIGALMLLSFEGKPKALEGKLEVEDDSKWNDQ